MRAGPRAFRKDGNHAALAGELRQCGLTVLDAAGYGMPFDLLVRRAGWPDGRWTAVEVKVSRRSTLTATEAVMLCDGGIVVAVTTEDVLDAIGMHERGGDA